MTSNKDFPIQFGEIKLSAPEFLLNGQIAPVHQAEIIPVSENTIRLVTKSDEPPQSFGLRFAVAGANRFLQMGYQSWDGSGYRDLPALGESLEGFAVAQLVCGEHFLQLGFLRHDRFQHRFTVRNVPEGLFLDVEVLWDGRAPLEGTDFASEPLQISGGNQAENLLREWARRVAEVSPIPPRKSAPITGWCSWYNLYSSINEENILEHLKGVQEAVKQHDLPMQVFQIDDGFNPEMGDWLDFKPQFPHGIKPLLNEIRAAGFTPGLWIAPFLVGNRSKLYARHPDWVVIDRQTDAPLICMNFYGEFRWHKRSEEYYLLDTTHPEAMAYLREVFRTWRFDWGCEYFKTDFIFYLAQHGPERVKHFREGQTRTEIWVEAARAIREEIGDAVWLGCGTPLWMPIGLMDALRIGRDVGAKWDTGVKAEQHFENLAVRNFAHGLFWQADPDCVLLREQYHHLTAGEVEALARTSAMTGGVMTTSDDLAILSPQRLELWKEALGMVGGHCHFPLLGTELGRELLVQVREHQGGWLVHLLNPNANSVSAELRFEQLGLPQVSQLQHWHGKAVSMAQQSLKVVLPAHGDSLFLLRT